MKTGLILASLLLPLCASAQSHKLNTEGLKPLELTADQMRKMFAPFFQSSPLKRKNPNQLAVIVAVGPKCTLKEHDALDTARGVLIRSRIKPLKVTIRDPFALNITIDCFRLQNGQLTAFAVEAQFTDYINGVLIAFGARHGTLGTYGETRSDYLVQTLKDVTEEAVTDYLKANFNLSPQ